MEIMLLKTCLKELESSLEALVSHIQKSPDLFIATHPAPFLEGQAAILTATLSISDLYYSDAVDDGRFTPICVGAIGVSGDGVQSAITANLAKDRFHFACKNVMENARSRGNSKLSATGKAKRLRAILTELGYPRLSLRQCFRHFPVLHNTPVDIRFSYSGGGRSIKRITVEEAKAYLANREYESRKAMIQAEKVAAFHPDTPLALVQELPGYYKANIWHEPKSDPQTIPAFLPIIYPHDANKDVARQQKLPDAQASKKRRGTRSDRKLQDEPVVTGVRIYGYKPDA